MKMRSNIQKVGNTLIIAVDGRLNFDNQDDLIKTLKDLSATRTSKKPRDTAALRILFDLSALEFAGSAGISYFVQNMRDFGDQMNLKPQILGASKDFQRVIKAFDPDKSLEFIDKFDSEMDHSPSRFDN